MSLNLDVIARNPPMAFIVAGLVLVLFGYASNYPDAVTIGIWCFFAGFLLQILWLFCVKRGRL